MKNRMFCLPIALMLCLSSFAGLAESVAEAPSEAEVTAYLSERGFTLDSSWHNGVDHYIYLDDVHGVRVEFEFLHDQFTQIDLVAYFDPADPALPECLAEYEEQLSALFGPGETVDSFPEEFPEMSREIPLILWTDPKTDGERAQICWNMFHAEGQVRLSRRVYSLADFELLYPLPGENQ